MLVSSALVLSAGQRFAVASVSVGMLILSAGQLFAVASVVMLMLFALVAAGQFAAVASVIMCMLFQIAGQLAAVAAVVVRVAAFRGFFTDQLALHFRIAGVCVLMTGYALGLALFAYEDFRFLVAVFIVLVQLDLFQRAHEISILIITIVIMYVNHIVCTAADRISRGITVLVLFIAVIRVLMHLVLTFQHFDLVGHRLAVHFQSRGRTEYRRYRETQEHCQPAFIIFLFLQKLCSL